MYHAVASSKDTLNPTTTADSAWQIITQQAQKLSQITPWPHRHHEAYRDAPVAALGQSSWSCLSFEQAGLGNAWFEAEHEGFQLYDTIESIPPKKQAYLQQALKALYECSFFQADDGLTQHFLSQKIAPRVAWLSPHSEDVMASLLLKWHGNPQPHLSKHHMGQRLLVILEPATKADILICKEWTAILQAMAYDGVDIYVGKGAKLSLSQYVLQQDLQKALAQKTSWRLYLETDGEVALASIMADGGCALHDIQVVLAGNNSHCDMICGYMGQKQSHMQVHSCVQHVGQQSRSRQYVKGLMTDEAKGVFIGEVKVHHQAKGSDAKQQNRHLLLSPFAAGHARPCLEIDTDDVKCSHGATSGQLDEQALFYLCSRGLSRLQAEAALASAFFGDLFSMWSHEDDKQSEDLPEKLPDITEAFKPYSYLSQHSALLEALLQSFQEKKSIKP